MKVVVFCEGFDTQTKIHRLRRLRCITCGRAQCKPVQLWNNVNCSDSWADWHVALSAFHRDHETKVRQRGFRFNLSFVPSAQVCYLAEFDEMIVRRNCPHDEPLS